MTAQVRPAVAGEGQAIVGLYEWLFAPPGVRPPQWDAEVAVERLERAISAPASTVLVAVAGERFAGLCTAYLDLDSVRFGKRCWIEDMAVDPEMRSGGIGKALLEAARAWARENGATHVELDSGDARKDAHRFYEREKPAWTSRQFTWLVDG